MKELFFKLYCKYLNNEEGLGIIELAIIIVIIVGLAIIFKDRVTDLLESLFDSIEIETFKPEY